MNKPGPMKTARPRGPVDEPLTQRDCEADGATQAQKPDTNVVPLPPRHPATSIGE